MSTPIDHVGRKDLLGRRGPSNYVWTHERKDLLTRLVVEGKFINSIAAEMGIHRNVAYLQIRKMGLKTVGVFRGTKQSDSVTKYTKVQYKYKRPALLAYKTLVDFYKNNPSVKINIDPITYEVTSNLKYRGTP